MKELLDILGGIMDAALALWIGTGFAMWQKAVTSRKSKVAGRRTGR